MQFEESHQSAVNFTDCSKSDENYLIIMQFRKDIVVTISIS